MVLYSTGIISVGRDSAYANENKGEDWELPLFDFNIIASATNNFSDNCKLGEGGYGPVYKVILGFKSCDLI